MPPVRTPPDPASFGEQWRRGEDFLRPHREKYAQIVREMVGRHGTPDDTTKRPINIIRSTLELLLPQIVSEAPKVRVTTRRVQFRAEADLLAETLEHLLDEIEAEEVFEEAVIDALLAPMGLILTGLKAGRDVVDIDGALTDVAQPYAVVLDFEDYCCDPTARHPRQVAWEGHRLVVRRSRAIKAGTYGQDPAEWPPGVDPSPFVATREEAERILRGLNVRKAGEDPKGGPTVEEIPGDRERESFDFDDKVELLHAAFHEHDCTYIGVLPADRGHQAKWLRWYAHDGPEGGPYHKLWFTRVPKSPIPLSPASGWLDLHEGIVKIVNKTIRQMMRQKSVFPYTRGTGQDDARSIKEAADGEFFPVDSAQSVVRQDVGGVAPENYEALGFLTQAANKEAGNPELLAGLDGSDTATEDQNKQSRMNARLRRFINRSNRFARSVVRALGWYIHTDELIQKPIARRIPGGEHIQLFYDAATREADFYDLTFDIERYSEGAMDPAVRARRVVEFLNLLGRMLPLVQSGAVSLQGLERIGREEFGIEAIDDLIPDPTLMLAIAQLFAGAGPPLRGQLPAGPVAAMGAAPTPGGIAAAHGTAGGMGIHQTTSARHAGAPY